MDYKWNPKTPQALEAELVAVLQAPVAVTAFIRESSLVGALLLGKVPSLDPAALRYWAHRALAVAALLASHRQSCACRPTVASLEEVVDDVVGEPGFFRWSGLAGLAQLAEVHALIDEGYEP